VFYLLDIIGTMAFALSGALTAMNKRLDPFGILIIAFVTAVGGGTLRDVLIGRTPVGWMLNLNYVYVILSGIFWLFFSEKDSINCVNHCSFLILLVWESLRLLV